MASTMTVLALMPDSYSGLGGIAQYSRDFLDAVSEIESVAGIVSITRHRGRGAHMAPATIIELPRPGNPLKYTATAVLQAIRSRPDVIVCGHINLLSVAALLQRILRVPLVLLVYGVEVWHPLQRRMRASLRHVTVTVSISRYTRTQYLRRCAVAPWSVRIIPNAIRPDAYFQAEKPRYLLDRYNLHDKRILLTLGRLAASEQLKGHDKILRVLPRLLREYPDLAYVIAGSGDDSRRLQECACAHGIRDRVVFTGNVPEEEVLDHYNMADAFAMPSIQEGFGFVFLEAAACGLPVLGGNRDGSCDALQDGELGIMIDPEDDDDLFDGLRTILAIGKSVPPSLVRFSYSNLSQSVRSLFSRLLPCNC